MARRPAEGEYAEVAGQTFEFTTGDRLVAAGSTPVERGRFKSNACVNLYFALREQGFEVFDLGCEKNTFRIGFPDETFEVCLVPETVAEMASRHLGYRRLARGTPRGGSEEPRSEG